MPFMKNGKRDYAAEKKWEHEDKPSRLKDRAARHRARRAAGLKDGDPGSVDHKKPLTEGGSNSKSNIRIIPLSENVKKEANRKKRAAK